MTEAAAMKPIETRRVEPAADRDTAALRPTETRYGWCPYGDINLMNADGTVNLYVQPHEIDEAGKVIENPYHRTLPKGQLIPFITFNALEMRQSDTEHDAMGRPKQVQGTRTVTALSAARDVLHRHSEWGFVILDSMTGLDQDTAFRIFQTVHPLEYPLGSLINEMAFGAQERIDSTEPITFAALPDYVVQPLRNDQERAIARKVAAEMENGAQIAFDLATEQLNTTETSMTTRFAGGQGKTGPDPLDRRLSNELGRDLPKLIGKPDATGTLAEMKEAVTYLAGREQSRADKERIAELEAKIAEMQAGQPEAPQIGEDTMKEPLPYSIGDEVTTTGGMTGKVVAKPFGKYTVEFEGGERQTLERSELT